MSIIKIHELEAKKYQLTDLKDFETIKIIGGYDEESESSKDKIQKAMREAVNRSDMSSNSKSTAFNNIYSHSN